MNLETRVYLPKTRKFEIIVGTMVKDGNAYDGNTLKPQLIDV